MKWNFENDRPIYSQLIEQIQLRIVSGEYLPGESIPSVRTLAIEAEVNPNTMQRAFAELEAGGLICTHRTTGRFVTEDINMINNLKTQLAQDYISTFFDGMKSLGIEEQEALILLEKKVNNAEKEDN